MLIELIATLAAGFAGAGIALILRHLTGGRLPKGAAPLAAGLAMVAFVIWNDYNWYERTTEGLDERLELAASYPESAIWRPWSYLLPVTERFMAYDRASIRTNETAPGHVLADVYFFGRRMPPAGAPVLLDCEGLRRGDVRDDFAMGEDGSFTGVDWFSVPPDDPLVGALCNLA